MNLFAKFLSNCFWGKKEHSVTHSEKLCSLMDGPEIQTSRKLDFDLLVDAFLLCSFGLIMPW